MKQVSLLSQAQQWQKSMIDQAKMTEKYNIVCKRFILTFEIEFIGDWSHSYWYETGWFPNNATHPLHPKLSPNFGGF